MATADFFSASYADARAKFRDAANDAGAEIVSYENPTRLDLDGIGLTTDVALLGPKAATRCLLLISGTHGVEGFAGSGCQVGVFRDKLNESLGKDTLAVFVHALNPYGFAYVRRVNEDNIDLNRNCQDFSQELPPNSEYAALHSLLIPTDWDGDGRKQADALLGQYIQKKGFGALKDAVSAGQYTHPSGLFYGGSHRSWSIETFQKILRTYVPHTVERIIGIDLHTGLGPFAYGEPIFLGSDLAQFFRAQKVFGPELKSLVGDSTSSMLEGTLNNALDEALPMKDKTLVGLEFGTVPVGEVLTALRADHWLESEDNVGSPLRPQIKKALRDAFYVDSPRWKAAVYGRTADFFTRAARLL